MNIFSSEKVFDHHNKTIFVKDTPYQHSHIENFLPDDLIEKVSENFSFPEGLGPSSDALFQKTKRGLDDYKQFPKSIQNFIDHLNSETFVKILENKFKIPGLIPDPTLFGGGMHESRKGGYLKLHSDFILKVYPHINNAVVFRTDTESNHGFPDPIKCPDNEGRKSIAVYYYIKENSFFKRTKYFYARWKRRPGVDEPKFGDNRNIINSYFAIYKLYSIAR